MGIQLRVDGLRRAGLHGEKDQLCHLSDAIILSTRKKAMIVSLSRFTIAEILL